MKKIKVIFIPFILFIASSCDPERYCNEPACLYSDVNVIIEAKLSGNIDSIINIGDTIWLQVKIPDTMQTNYGEIVFSYLWRNSFFGLISGGGDSLHGEGTGVYINTVEMLPISILPLNEKYGARKWDYPTRNFRCFFVPLNKGKYVIELNGGRIEMTDNKGKDWLINPSFTLNQPFRLNQYLSWMSEGMRPEAEQRLKENKNWYCFEVK
jgi:hypothetical protein